MANVYTTGQVAKLCDLSTHTIDNLIKTGKLKYRLLPGSNHRRIDRKDLDQFVKENNIERAAY